jgi:hypothetical protein
MGSPRNFVGRSLPAEKREKVCAQPEVRQFLSGVGSTT